MYRVYTEKVSPEINPVVKIFWLSSDGSLVSPIMTKSRWRQPLIRSRQFETDPELDGSGIFAYRYGHIAAPMGCRTVMAICRIQEGSRAVISPWAVQSEAMTIERLILSESLLSVEDVHDRVRRLWSPHCDIEYRSRDCDYTANQEPLCFNLRLGPRRDVNSEDGFICFRLDGECRMDMLAHRKRGVMIWRTRSRHDVSLQGPYLSLRVDRVIRRWYETGNEYVRDILAPWIRYFDQIRQSQLSTDNIA